MAETIPVRFDILHAYAERNRLDFNDLCRTMRDAIAEGSAALTAAGATVMGAGSEDEPPLDWEALPEDDDVREQFDRGRQFHRDDVRIQIATALELWANGAKGSTYADMCRVMANEVVKLRLATPPAADAAPAASEPASGAVQAQVLTDEEREHIHQAIEMLGDYEVTQREAGNDSTASGASATRYVLEKLFRFLPGRTALEATAGATVMGVGSDAARYRKLRGWMSSNVSEGWNEVERMGALCAWESWEAMDAYLDGLPECNAGLMEKAATPTPAPAAVMEDKNGRR